MTTATRGRREEDEERNKRTDIGLEHCKHCAGHAKIAPQWTTSGDSVTHEKLAERVPLADLAERFVNIYRPYKLWYAPTPLRRWKVSLVCNVSNGGPNRAVK